MTATGSEGGGGTVYGTNGNVHGASRSTPIQSTTHNHAEFFSRSTDGKERVLKTRDEAVSVKTGNGVSLFWAISVGKDAGQYVAIMNHDTGRFSFVKSGVELVAGSWMSGISYTALFIGFLAASAAWTRNVRGRAPPPMEDRCFFLACC